MDKFSYKEKLTSPKMNTFVDEFNATKERLAQVIGDDDSTEFVDTFNEMKTFFTNFNGDNLVNYQKDISDKFDAILSGIGDIKERLTTQEQLQENDEWIDL